MDELVKLVSEKTGIPEATAKQATEVVLGWLKDKLPEPIGSQLDVLVSGGGAADPGDVEADLVFPRGLLPKK
jgi:hypothetical protein